MIDQAWGEQRSKTVTWHDPAPALPVMASMDGLSYLRPVRAGDGMLTATGRATKPGKRAAFADREIRDEHDRLVATASSTLLVFAL